MTPKALLVLSSLLAGLAAFAVPAAAAPTQYPLTIENCGAAVTFEKAPERVVALGQNSAEILLLLGLEDRMVGTAFWPNTVLPQLAEANAKVPLLTVEFPTFEAVLATEPDFVAAALPTLLGPDSKVAKREDFETVGVPSYLSPGTCLARKEGTDAYGARDALWNMDILFQEIDELARIFDVEDRGQALIADLKAREATLRAESAKGAQKLTFVFWFSSPSPSADAYLSGRNSASAFIADVLGGSNAVQTDAESPQLGWESIIALDPDVIVVAKVDRNRWELDKAEAKIAFLTSDPATSQMRAVQNKAMVIMDGQAMNPTVRTIYGAEQVAEQLKALGLRQ